MKLTAVILGLATLGVASSVSVVDRDFPTVQKALNSVLTSLKCFDSRLNSYHGGPPILLHLAGADLITALGEQRLLAVQSSALDESEAEVLIPLAVELSELGHRFVQDFRAAKRTLAQAGLCPFVLQHINKLDPALSDFFLAIIARIPVRFQLRTQELLLDANINIARLRDEFAPGYCVSHPHRLASPIDEPPTPTTSAIYYTPTGWRGSPTGNSSGPHASSKPASSRPLPTAGAAAVKIPVGAAGIAVAALFL